MFTRLLILGVVFCVAALSFSCGRVLYSTNQTVVFTVSPMEASNFSAVGPMGSVNPRMGHAFPTDHGYFRFRENIYPPSYNVYVPANGTITKISYVVSEWPVNSGQTGTYKDWQIDIEHTPDIKSRFGHMSSVEASILAQAGSLMPDIQNTVSIPVSAGDVLGLCGGRPEVVYNLDWYIIDQSVNLDFIHPERYGRMLRAAHFLDYCSESLQAQYTPLFFNPNGVPVVTRETEPLGGKIDHDQLGKLSGNWFHNSITTVEAAIAEYNKQLAFIYDEFDPTKIIITFGGPEGEIGGSTVSTPLGLYVTTYQVVGNSPDPTTVNISSGEVTYQIKGLEILDETTIETTLLVEITGNETVSVEGFDGHVDNPSFTSNVQTYIR